jgi:3-hydroxyacyl-[acyl-carrier-protein] dehydratase
MTDEPKKPLDIEAILERLPHRYPFLLVDRVLSVEPGKSIVALKNVSVNEYYFVGHFPGHPVMPGVLVVEALAQAGGVLAWESSGESDIWILYLAGIDKVRFRGVVRPGDQLILKVDLVQRRRNLWRYEAVAEVDGKTVAEAELLMADGPKS